MATASKTVDDPTPLEDWISLPDAAQMLGVSRQSVLALSVKGVVVAQHIAQRTVVSRASIERFLARRDAAAANSSSTNS